MVHQDSPENKTNCFPRDYTLSVYCFSQINYGNESRFGDINVHFTVKTIST